jgi:hypothetical protein
LVGKLKEGDYLEALGAGGMIILKFIFINKIEWHEKISVGQKSDKLRCLLKLALYGNGWSHKTFHGITCLNF